MAAGQVLLLDNLPAGEHTVTLAVSDRSGQMARAEHRVRVTP